MNPTPLQVAGAIVLVAALVHAFSSAGLQHLAEQHPRHGGLFRLLGEAEVVFAFWALVLVGAIVVLQGPRDALAYAESRNFTEPLFVFAIMIVAGSRPVSALAFHVVELACRFMPLPRPLAVYLVALAVLPLLGSLITEPAAMTLAAMVLRDRVFRADHSERLRYATLGVLFVNVSLGGLLTTYAAPPVLMVAERWGWDTEYMLRHFAVPAVLTVLVNAAGAAVWWRRELVAEADVADAESERPAVPGFAMAASAALLAGIVAASHHPVVFLGLLLLFIGYSAAYPRHHDPLLGREALLVASFLAGLVVLAGLQRWWLEPVLTSMSPTGIYHAAAALTALTDNAALTYLGAQVPGLDETFKRALVAGALVGGGLTVIANAPNPVGAAILRAGFRGASIGAGRLLAAAVAPTLVALVAFRVLD